ncbi:MAG: threonine-phosphate decarboxylase CobD [Thermodesulfovibrionia bacterium]|nr:threonine-phosphate decarboxylase CobD [Thermodesulfovibrionia bacterium]
MKTITPNSLEHGGNIYRIAEELGVSESRLIDFSASINPLGISDKVKDVINRELNGLVNYPDPDTKMLRHKIAEHNGIDPETIICGNGSTELIYLIPRALKPRKVLIPAPTFSEYERACRLSSKLRVESYELKKENGFEVIPDKFIKAMQGCDMAFLCNPNNPTGHLLEKHDVLMIAEAAKKMKCYLIVDEAFIDFVPEGSVIRDVQENPYLIVLRSMTKFYALTGLRIGYGVFHKDLIERIKEFKEPWTVNHLAQKTAIAAIADDEYAVETHDLIKREKEFLEKSFQELNIKYLPSSVNYYLLKMENPERIVSALNAKGILVRDCSNFRGLEGSYIRVAVKSRSDNEMLLKELSKLR